MSNLVKKNLFITIILCFSFAGLPAQETDLLWQQAKKAEAERNDEKALQSYLDLVRISPDHREALCKASELYCILGKRQLSESKQKEYYRLGLQLARKVYALYPDYAEANFVMSLAMGRLALMASGEEKINAVRDIKKFAEKTIQLDPQNFKGYHVLGKWHFEVSSLSAWERWLVRVAFGALPSSSFAASISYYEKSRQLKPGFLLNYLELAKAYQANGQPKAAVNLLQMMTGIPDTTAEDKNIRQEGKELLAKWNQ